MTVAGAVRVGVWILALSMASTAAAQELEPRAYRTLPTGVSFLVMGYTRIDGNVAGDPTAPLQDLNAELDIVGLGYLRALSLFGRSASISVSLPYAFLDGSALFRGERVSGSRSGMRDARLKLAVNLVGGPALSPQEFAAYRQRRNVGVSLTVAPPTGQYDSTRLINFGTNRWAFKPEVGYSSIRGRWILEAAAGLWFFTDNGNVLGASKEQRPIGNLQGHVSYDFKPGLWLSLDANYFEGGRTKIDGMRRPDAQESSRVGLALSLPLVPGQSIKLAYHVTAFEDGAADFDAVTVAYQLRWGSWRRGRR